MIKILIGLLLTLGACNDDHEHSAPPPVINFPPPDIDPPPVRPPPRPGFYNLDLVENSMLLDAQNLIGGINEREDTRYFVGCNRHNIGSDLDLVRQAVDLGLNRLSNERFLATTTPITPANCIFRIDLTDFGITKEKWELLEDNTVLDFESETVRNQNLQFLLNTRKPYVFFEELIVLFEGDEVTDNNGDIYYTFTEQALDTATFLADEGVVVQDAIDDQTALFSGFSQSIIALGKSRLIGIFEQEGAAGGYCMSTFDTALGQGTDLFETPFIAELVTENGVLISDKILDFQAQEHICFLNNGLVGKYRLNNAANFQFEVEAPTNIVINRDNPVGTDASIRIMDCNRCHYSNVAIPVTDSIGEHIRNNSAFDQDEKLRGEIFFNYTRVAAILDEINRRNGQALQELGITAVDDPITSTMAPFRAEMDLEQVASYTFLTPDEFRERLRGTAVSSQVFGNLLTGNKVSLDTLNSNFETLVDELNLFQDIEL